MFVRSSRTHSAVCVSACRSASLSAPASLILHGWFIKSGDGVGRVDCSLAQLHSSRIKFAHSMIRVVDIFHHITINGTVNHFGFSVRRRRLLLASCYRLLLLRQPFLARLFTCSECAYQPFRYPAQKMPAHTASTPPTITSFVFPFIRTAPSTSARFPDPGVQPARNSRSSVLSLTGNPGRRRIPIGGFQRMPLYGRRHSACGRTLRGSTYRARCCTGRNWQCRLSAEV